MIPLLEGTRTDEGDGLAFKAAYKAVVVEPRELIAGTHPPKGMLDDQPATVAVVAEPSKQSGSG